MKKKHTCQTIHDFFDTFSLADAQWLWRQAMLAAESDHVCKGVPADMDAAHLVHVRSRAAGLF